MKSEYIKNEHLKISIVVPTYKEAENIRVLVERVVKAIENEEYTYEIIFVDDYSNDGIDEVVCPLQDNFNVQLIIRKDKRGLASAVIDGMRYTTGEIIVVMDADLSHPPEKIPELVNKIIDGDSDFVIGSRFAPGGGIPHFNYFRKLNALVSKIMARPLTKVKDPMAGFFAFRKNLIHNFNMLNPLGFKICLELLVKLNPRKISEVPIIFEERISGKSKLNFREQVNYLVHLQRLYHYKFMHVVQLVEFAIIGSLGMIIDLASVYISYECLNIQYQFARLSGFFFAATLNFLLHRIITFPNSPRDKSFRQYIRFIFVCLMGMSVNWSISVYLYRSLSFFSNHYLMAALLGIMGGFLINFAGSKFYVFNKKE